MRLRSFWILGGISALAAVSVLDRAISAAGSSHDYFDSLVARRDVFKAYSLRPVPGEPITSPHYGQQLARRADGGYAASNSAGQWITYRPGADPDAHAQDAAKVVIPAFTPPGTFGVGTTTQAIGAQSDPITLTGGYGPLYAINGRSVLIDAEIMNIYDPDGSGPIKSFDRDTGVLYVQRGQHGTAAANHAAGTSARLSINTVPNAVRLPLGTTDGHTYFFTWDGYWTDSYIRTGLTNHKAFNFISDGIWLEPQTNYGGGTGAGKISGFDLDSTVAAFQIRSYNRLNGPVPWTAASENYTGPGVTSGEPLAPQLATFAIKPNRWVRFFVRIEQRPNDYDYVDTWIADEMVGPVQIHRRLPVSVREGAIGEFVLEYNTSTDLHRRGNLRDLIAYSRNFVSLQDPGDVTGLLQRPGSSGGVVAGPAAPQNLRVLKQ